MDHHDLDQLRLNEAPFPLVAHFQPILELGPESLSLYAFEALIRGPHSSFTESPDLLYDSLQDGYDRCLVDLTCIRQILLAAMALPRTTFLSINVHLETLTLITDFATFLLDELRQCGIPPQRIILELVPDDDRLQTLGEHTAIRTLRAQGVSFALDNFGMGQSNLHLLLEVRPEYLKPAPYLIRNLMEDPWRQTLLEGICNLAVKAQTTLVVKGLETPGDFRIARWMGATLFQGHLFAVPGPIELWQETPFPQEWPLRTFMRPYEGTILPLRKDSNRPA